MRSYSDMLRDEMPMSSVGSQDNPEVAKARALLICAKVGPSWSERDFVGKSLALVGHALLWLVLAVCTASFAEPGLLLVGILGFDVGGPSCRGACEDAWFVWIIRTSILTGVIGGRLLHWVGYLAERAGDRSPPVAVTPRVAPRV